MIALHSQPDEDIRAYKEQKSKVKKTEQNEKRAKYKQKVRNIENHYRRKDI